MCGIAGIFATNRASKPLRPGEAILMRDSMESRGPDGYGLYYEGGAIALAHRRLSIIDLSDCGRQPMTTPDGRYTITFNGEIYNYKPLKERLKAEGVAFRSDSDTEVLLHLFARYGTSFLHELRGMFAVGIWDDHEKRLTLATDPFGIKPLYTSWTDGTLRFASQVKALLRCPGVDVTPSAAGHTGFFIWGSVPEPHTLYRGIQALGAGGLMTVEFDGTVRSSRWIRIRDELAAASSVADGMGEADAEKLLRDAMGDTVRHHLIADVPVSVFLSAGLDSTTLAAHAQENSTVPVQTITLAFNEFVGSNMDESVLAQRFADEYHTHHRRIVVDGSSFNDEILPYIRSMDQPSIDAINTYFVSRAAASTGAKVVLSGLGGDELFGGYESFTQVPKAVRTFGWARYLPPLGKTFRGVSGAFFRARRKPKMAGLFEYGSSIGGAYLLRRALFMPWELNGLLNPEVLKEGLQELNTLDALNATVQGVKSPRLAISALEAEWYMRNMLLRDSDWASMAHSIELRTPLVDIDLWRQVAPLVAAHEKVNKRAMAGTPAQALPPEILNRKKTGFAIPLHDWIQGGQSPVARESALRTWARQVHAAYLLVKPVAATDAEIDEAYRQERSLLVDRRAPARRTAS